MSSNETQQKQGLDFVFKTQPTLVGGAGFAAITGGGISPSHPNAGNTLRPYAAAGSRQIAQQIIYTHKVETATALLGQAFVGTVADLGYRLQVGMAIARVNSDEEQRAFLEDFVRNGANFLAVKYAQLLEVLYQEQETLIRQGVEPSLFDHIKALMGK
jgi:hypothetical protein